MRAPENYTPHVAVALGLTLAATLWIGIYPEPVIRLAGGALPLR